MVTLYVPVSDYGGFYLNCVFCDKGNKNNLIADTMRMVKVKQTKNDNHTRDRCSSLNNLLCLLAFYFILLFRNKVCCLCD